MLYLFSLSGNRPNQVYETHPYTMEKEVHTFNHRGRHCKAESAQTGLSSETVIQLQASVVAFMTTLTMFLD